MATGAAASGSDVEPAPVHHVGASRVEGWQLLPAATLRAWHLDNLVGLLVGLAVLGGLATAGHPAFLQPWLLPLTALALAAALLESAVVLPRRHRRYRFRLATGAVVVESGALIRRELVVPLHQVLYVETAAGPVLRAYGLARIRLGTIAEPKSVGPLSRADAELLRQAVETARPPAGSAAGQR